MLSNLPEDVLGLIFAAALAYRWAQEPKIERQLYGCTAHPACAPPAVRERS